MMIELECGRQCLEGEMGKWQGMISKWKEIDYFFNESNMKPIRFPNEIMGCDSGYTQACREKEILVILTKMGKYMDVYRCMDLRMFGLGRQIA